MKNLTYNTFINMGNYTIMKVKYKDIDLDVKLDNEDVDKVKSVGKWYADKMNKNSNKFYIKHSIQRNKKKYSIRLHRLITNCPDSKEVDHINRDTLDNRKSNLRVCDDFINARNRDLMCNNTSGILGVRAIVCKGKYKYYQSYFQYNNKEYRKTFKTIEQAIKYRKDLEREYNV